MSVLEMPTDRIAKKFILFLSVTPVITRKSIGNIVVKEGEKTKLDCGVGVGNPKPFDIQWWHNNIMLSTTKSNFEAPFVFNNTLRKDGGTYRCVARNQAGQDSYDVNLAVVCKFPFVYW